MLPVSRSCLKVHDQWAFAWIILYQVPKELSLGLPFHRIVQEVIEGSRKPYSTRSGPIDSKGWIKVISLACFDDDCGDTVSVSISPVFHFLKIYELLFAWISLIEADVHHVNPLVLELHPLP